MKPADFGMNSDGDAKASITRTDTRGAFPMKKVIFIFIAVVGAWMAGCAHLPNPFRDPFPNLVETQPQLVAGCDMLGTVTETADADRISDRMAKRAMLNKVRERATQLGATHLVWLHRTDASATAQAYRCPQPAAGREAPQTGTEQPAGDER